MQEHSLRLGKVKQENRRTISFSQRTPFLYVIGVGTSVAVNIALAKQSVMNGIDPLKVLSIPLLGAAMLLLMYLGIKGDLKSLNVKYFRYCLFAGLLGVSLPNLASNLALQELPASTFSVLLTLSPLFTLLLSIPFQRIGLSLRRITGIGISFVAVMFVTISPDFRLQEEGGIILIAISVPLFLAMGNIYRSRCYPTLASPIALATGVLCVQSLIWMPISIVIELESFSTISFGSWLVLFSMSVNSAFSYFLTFRLQALTDGLGFSQVGNVVTVVGIGIGILFFSEGLGYQLMVALPLLFVGLAMTNKSARN
ncbi:DMT family transporter [Vibrio amylolyticus]|uniref:DMT family transporter n=1 Tax=Vibrio amylolyticus TaxID=2847292 RepID=UPI0035532B8A